MSPEWIVLVLLVVVNGNSDVWEHDVEEIHGDVGDSLLLPCTTEGDHHHHRSPGEVMWTRLGRDDHQVARSNIFPNGSLSLTDLSTDDVGIYTCTYEDTTFNKFEVKVRTPPPALVNVTVIPSTILALLRWDVEDTGGYPITHFTAQYRLRHTPPQQLPDPWHPVIPGKISPSASQIDVYQLEPNSTYVFQVWANNKLGRGEIVELEALTMHDPQEIELGKHLLEGAQNFDTRVWVVAVAVVMGTLVILATATVYALYRECHLPLIHKDETETMELIPNIILNPGYQEEQLEQRQTEHQRRTERRQTEWFQPDENSNDRSAFRLNNNTVINPIRI